MVLFNNWFSFGADSSAPKSSDFGLRVTAVNIWDSPSRDVSTYQVSGLNGDVVIDNGRYSNVSVTYDVSLVAATNTNLAAIRNWLVGIKGYQRIYDSYDTNIFREGVFSGSVNYTMSNLLNHGSAKLTFSCKPQRFIATSFVPVEWDTTEGAKTFTNVSNQPCYPLIDVRIASGTHFGIKFDIGSDSYRFNCYTSTNPTLRYDFERQNVYEVALDGTTKLVTSVVDKDYSGVYDMYIGSIEVKPGETFTFTSNVGGNAHISLTMREWEL